MKFKKAIKIVAKIVLFPLVFVLTFSGVQSIMQVKWAWDQNPASLITSQFYDVPENSIDVLFLGTCNTYNSINTMVLWEDHGIASYDFGCPDQPVLASYYYLKEALSRQKPRLVVLDALMLINFVDTKEEHYRWSLDYMPLSKNKTEFSQAVYGRGGALNPDPQDDTDRTLDVLTGIFPLLRYHDRWMSLEENDFRYYTDQFSNVFMGFTPVFYSAEFIGSTTYMEDGDETATFSSIRPEAIDYFDQILALCQQEDISLLLVKTPSAYYWNAKRSQNVADFAEQRGVPYIDYNWNYADMGIDWTVDAFQPAGLRLNAWGSEKFTHQLGRDLKERYDLADQRNNASIAPLWDQALATYKEKKALYDLTQIQDLDSYLSALQSYVDRYEIVVAYKRGDSNLSDAHLAALRRLGFDPISHEGDLFSYLGVHDRTGLLYEESSSDKVLRYENSFYPNFLVQADGSQIFLNRSDYTRLGDGLGIVIYDREERRLIDAVGCDPIDPQALHRGAYASSAFSTPDGVP